MKNRTTYEIPFKKLTEGFIVIDASKDASTETLLFLTQKAWQSGAVTRTQTKTYFKIDDIRVSSPADQ